MQKAAHALCQRQFHKNFTVDVNTICCGLFLSPIPPRTLTLMLMQLHSEHVDGINLAEKQQPFQKLFSAGVVCETSWSQSSRTALREPALW